MGRFSSGFSALSPSRMAWCESYTWHHAGSILCMILVLSTMVSFFEARGFPQQNQHSEFQTHMYIENKILRAFECYIGEQLYQNLFIHLYDFKKTLLYLKLYVGNIKGRCYFNLFQTVLPLSCNIWWKKKHSSMVYICSGYVVSSTSSLT